MEYDYKKLTPFKWFVLQNFPFIDADFDAITNWQLFCKLGEEINKVINAVNTSGEQVENLTNAFNNLQNYVNNYFSNLDVQEEIDNKLDDMAEAGTLQEIINEYLSIKTLLAFDTIADLKESENLINGSFARTMGFYSKNDGGSALYKIRNITNNDVVDEITIFELADDNLVAELVNSGILNSRQLGIDESLTDNSVRLQKLFDFSETQPVELLEGQYKITNPIYFSLTMSININGHVEIQDYKETTGSTLICKAPINNSLSYIKQVFNNSAGILRLINYKTNINKNGLEIGSENYTSSGIIKGLNIRYYQNAMLVHPKNFYGIKFENCTFAFSKIGIRIADETLVNSGEAVNFVNCAFVRNECGIHNSAEFVTKYDECIFDNNVIALYSEKLNVDFQLVKSHFEGINELDRDDITTYEGKNGICCVGDSDKAYNKSSITLTDCLIYALNITHYPTYLFDGSTLNVYLNNVIIWYGEQFNTVINSSGDTSGFIKMFACSDKVRKCYVNNNIFRYDGTTPEFRLKKNNLVNAFFEGVDTTQEETNLWNLQNIDLGDYEIEILQTTEKGTKVKFEVINNMTCLKVTPKQDYTMAVFNLKYKNYIQLKGENFDCFSFMKGMKNASNTYTTVNIEIYDKDLNLLTTLNNVGTNYGGTTSYFQWFTNKYIDGNRQSNNDYRDNTLPSNAVYFKPVYQISALRGHFADREEGGETITCISPVYVTGLYCYNY